VRAAVAETLTTSRSWRSRSCGSSSKRALNSDPSWAVGDHQPDAVTPEAALLGARSPPDNRGRIERDRAPETTSPELDADASSRAE